LLPGCTSVPGECPVDWDCCSSSGSPLPAPCPAPATAQQFEHVSSVVHRDRFDADTDPDQYPPFHFYADPDLDPDTTPCFTNVGKSLLYSQQCLNLVSVIGGILFNIFDSALKKTNNLVHRSRDKNNQYAYKK
jgi:hypothetical protein